VNTRGIYQSPRKESVEWRVCRDPNDISSHRNPTLFLLTLQADLDTMTDAACGDHRDQAIHRSTGGHTTTEPELDRPHVGPSIISIVQTCFEGLTDPAHSLGTRRLMLQNYQVATKLLRSALTVNATDRSLAALMGALALYEVCFELLCPICYVD
jgi:hypothetical protein